ncbi:MAG: hypothetical protein A2009_05190 [Tenericutes bacterium GWD2_38_27]|nr:MAG: hypothetical protein A2009_05190 [Tenericutes bacterium GWD2_38_27]HBG32534.1 hypothetical protein [Acholeplasmataceae bacterium]HCB67575.1 hypothetical protein [Acholeplasmataceae bacterium]
MENCMRCVKCKAVIKDNVNGCPECGYKELDDLSSINLGGISSLKKENEQILPNGYPRHYYHHEGKRGVFAILALYKNIVKFTGVSDWIEYWTQSLFMIAITIFAFEIRERMILAQLNPSLTLRNLYFFTLVLFMVTILAYSTAKIRRLRDAGFSPWFFLLGGISDILTLFKYTRNEHNRAYEKMPTIKVNYEEKIS